MPKRKERPSDIQDESPASKLCKKDSTLNPSKHARSKVPSSRPPQKTLKTISSNWRTLSKTLGISCKRREAGASNGRRTKREESGGRSRGGGGGGSRVEEEEEVWFDDIPLEYVDGDLVPKQVESGTRSVSLVTGNDKSAGRYVSLDCEMVGTGPDGSFSMVAHVCLVNHHGNVLLDTHVAPMDKVTDYRTAISGVSPKDLRGAPEFKVVQEQVSDILKDRILVGHSVQNDLKALLLSHPKRNTRDTSKYRPFKKIAQTRYPSLKKLAKEILGLDIHSREHSPVEDARVAMKLYQLHKRDWETSVKARLTRREVRDRRRERRRKEEDSNGGLQKSTRQTRAVVEQPFNVMLYTER